MKGSGGKVEFEKKYCGRQTASLKFTGDQAIKIIFKVKIFYVMLICSCLYFMFMFMLKFNIY